MFGTVRTLNVDLRFENLVSEKECKAVFHIQKNISLFENLVSEKECKAITDSTNLSTWFENLVSEKECKACILLNHHDY